MISEQIILRGFFGDLKVAVPQKVAVHNYLSANPSHSYDLFTLYFDLVYFVMLYHTFDL